MDVTTPPLFGSLWEIIALAVMIGVGWYALRRQVDKSVTQQEQAAKDASEQARENRHWQEDALQQVITRLNDLSKDHERVMTELVRSNERVLDALSSQKDRHADEHGKIVEKLVELITVSRK